MIIHLTKKDKVFDVFYNEVFVGQFYQEVDGYYVYSPNDWHSGFVDSLFLRTVADKLDKINKPWHDEVVKTLNKDADTVISQTLKWKPLTKEQMEKIVGEAQKAEAEYKECNCHACFNKNPPTLFRPFIVCPVCGNKRCPKASDHNNACTRSNEPGQAGSVY